MLRSLPNYGHGRSRFVSVCLIRFPLPCVKLAIGGLQLCLFIGLFLFHSEGLSKLTSVRSPDISNIVFLLDPEAELIWHIEEASLSLQNF